MLVGLPCSIREGAGQRGSQDQPLIVEGIEGVKPVTHLTDGPQLLQGDVVVFAELLQIHR